jgi:LuxR family maltose regulon positive regulatory protein
MIDALERVQDPHAWDRCFFLSILTGLPGLRPLLERFATGALRLAGDAPTQLRAGALHARAWLSFSDGRIDEAAKWLARADEDVRWLGKPRSLMTENWMTHTLLDAVRGDRDSSRAAAEENKRDLEEHSVPSNRLTHEYEELFTYIRSAWLLGEAPALRSLDAALARCANGYEWPAAADDRRFSRAFVALLDDRVAEARELLRPLAADIEWSCFFPATQARVMLADVELRLGAIDAAAARCARGWPQCMPAATWAARCSQESRCSRGWPARHGASG